MLKRVTPFNAQDLKVLSDALELTGNYFSPVELVLLIIGIVAVVLWVISMWRRGGQYTGKMHRIIAVSYTHLDVYKRQGWATGDNYGYDIVGMIEDMKEEES